MNQKFSPTQRQIIFMTWNYNEFYQVQIKTNGDKNYVENYKFQ